MEARDLGAWAENKALVVATGGVLALFPELLDPEVGDHLEEALGKTDEGRARIQIGLEKVFLL